jgi:hypothetical protein
LITLTTLGFAAFAPDGNTIGIYLAIGAALNIVYLFGTALTAESTTPRPRAWFYLLSAAAFAGWAFATLDEVQKKAGLTGDSATTKQGFILLVTAIFVPMLDVMLSRLAISD